MKNALTSTFTLIIFALFMSLSSFAQQVEISGQVKNKETKESLPYCKVVALDGKNKIVTGGLTDDKGYFKLPLNPGQYQLVVNYIGFESDTIQIGLIRESKFIGVIKLNPVVLDIDEVNVKASSRIDTPDKDVQVITDEQKVGSTAAKDVLNKVTGITYDDYAGVLKVDNDANILILVNGVEKSQEYVQNLEPERLLRVETIRDPGGRYGLEGYSAIVNLILKRNYKGTEVYVEQMQLVDINTEQEKLDYMIGSIGGTYNYTHNDLNIYAGAQIGRRKFKIYTETETNYNNDIVVREKAEMRNPNTVILQYNADYTLGFDYRINPKHLVSFESNISALPRSSEELTTAFETEVFTNGVLTDNYRFDSKTRNQSWDTYNTLFYIGDFNERNKLNVNFTHSYYEDSYFANTLQEGVYDRAENGINQKQFTRFYAEYDHIFSKKMSVQAGYGNTWRELNNNFDVIQTNLNSNQSISSSNGFRQTDTRHKLYANISYRLSRKWSTKLGLSVESSSPVANGQKRNYVIYQPLFDLRYVAGKNLNLKLKYRTSSAYPNISETNPFLSQVNPRITSVGNPFLRPSTTHRFSLRINIMKGLLAVEPYFHYSNNTVAKVGELDANNIFNFRFENANLFQRTGGRLNFSKYFKFSMLVQANFHMYHSKIVSSTRTNSLMDWRAGVDLIYIFKKTESLIGLKYQREQSKWISGLGYDKGDVDFWMLFYKQPLFKKKASVMFGYFLPINLGATYDQGSLVETDGFRMMTNNDVTLVKNMFILEFSYRFNKGKSIKKREKNIDRESEDGNGGLF